MTPGRSKFSRRKVVCGVIFLLLPTVSMAVWALNAVQVKSLYRTDNRRILMREQVHKLEFDLANEASMRVHQSYRFDGKDHAEMRARWFEQTATWYPLADVMQQLIDFRSSFMLNNEGAFNQMVEMGAQGDAGAACMASLLYNHHKQEVTQHWKYSYERVVKQALRYKDSGNPICVAVEGSLYSNGLFDYPKDKKLAQREFIKGAIAGFYGDQVYMYRAHIPGAERLEPNEMALELCWARVAFSQASQHDFAGTCTLYREGSVLNQDFKWVAAPSEIQRIIAYWCETTRIVSAQSCANLEPQNLPKNK